MGSTKVRTIVFVAMTSFVWGVPVNDKVVTVVVRVIVVVVNSVELKTALPLFNSQYCP